MIRILENLEIEGTYLNIIKTIQQAQSEHPAEQKKKEERKIRKALPLKSRVRQGFLPHHPFSILLNTGQKDE